MHWASTGMSASHFVTRRIGFFIALPPNQKRNRTLLGAVSCLTSVGMSFVRIIHRFPLLRLCSSFHLAKEEQQYVRNKYAYWL